MNQTDRLFSHNKVAILFIATIQNLQKNRVPRLGAALAFYMSLSLAPIVVLMLSIAGYMFGSKAAESRLLSEIQGLVGQSGAQVIGRIVESGYRPSHGVIATAVGLATLFFGATAVISEMQDALNTIWRVQDRATSSAHLAWLALARTILPSFHVLRGTSVATMGMAPFALAAAINWLKYQP